MVVLWRDSAGSGGIAIMRPSTMKAGALARAANWVAGLLGLALAAMAVARYL